MNDPHLHQTFWDKRLKDFVYVLDVVITEKGKPLAYIDPIGRTGKLANLEACEEHVLESYPTPLKPKTAGFVVLYDHKRGEFCVVAARVKSAGKNHCRCNVPTQNHPTWTHYPKFFLKEDTAQRAARMDEVEAYGNARRRLQEAIAYERKTNLPMRNPSERRLKALRAKR